jgi:hypothetical protein
MRSVCIAIVTVALSAGIASAFERREAKSITCSGAKTIIARDGGVVLRFPSKRIPDLT